MIFNIIYRPEWQVKAIGSRLYDGSCRILVSFFRSLSKHLLRDSWYGKFPQASTVPPRGDAGQQSSLDIQTVPVLAAAEFSQ
jgi:hypothetical protein